MKIILVDENHGESRAIVLRGWARAALTLCLLGLPVILGYVGHQLSASRTVEHYNNKAAQAWDDRLVSQQEEVRKAREEAASQLQALTRRIASLQARLMRLDALGERLTEVAEIDKAEFDFGNEPAVGGPELADYEEGFGLDVMETLDELALQVEKRQQQLEILDSLLFERRAESDAFLAGRPVTSGWMSSSYGRRIDPFSGNMAWHQGVDFATGEEGEDVIAVAAGMVTFAGDRHGYGNLIEINHGNGYETVYGHSKDLLVNAGDVVKKGQVIALSGNTGRSTGPHVHFEVHKNGRVVDPASYIHRTSR